VETCLLRGAGNVFSGCRGAGGWIGLYGWALSYCSLVTTACFSEKLLSTQSMHRKKPKLTRSWRKKINFVLFKETLSQDFRFFKMDIHRKSIVPRSSADIF
jgi:hypothetical protein